MSLAYIGQQITIYVGIVYIAAGLIGNGMNILVFSSVRTYRTTPCSFYFLMGSICNTAYIAINLVSRIVITGSGFDYTRTSLAWCKTRTYFLVFLSLNSFSCACLPSIDQFLVTSRSAYIRNLSNITWAHRIVIIIIIVSCLHAIPNLIYLDISPITQTCMNPNSAYTFYLPIYSLTLNYFIPVIIMLIFGYLTYRNINLTRILAEQRADRQLTKMTLVQVMLVLFSNTPYGINNIYGMITSTTKKDSDRVLKETFTTLMVILVTYTYYAGSCYAFLISSSRFRRAIRDRVLFWQRQTRVHPVEIMRLQTTRFGTTTATRTATRT